MKDSRYAVTTVGMHLITIISIDYLNTSSTFDSEDSITSNTQFAVAEHIRILDTLNCLTEVFLGHLVLVVTIDCVNND